MDRAILEQYIVDQYGAERENLWAKFPNYTVFRHFTTGKWFALFMDIPQNKIGLDGKKIIDVLNVRCDPLSVGQFLQQKGFYPAYHMNKNNWITVALNEQTDDNLIKWLLDLSFKSVGKK